MARDSGLTELTKHAILSSPLPDQPRGDNFAAVTYLHSDAHNPICALHKTSLHPRCYVSGSSGAQFDGIQASR